MQNIYMQQSAYISAKLEVMTVQMPTAMCCKIH